MELINILFLIKKFDLGGSPRICSEFIKHIDKRKYKPHLIVYSKEGDGSNKNLNKIVKINYFEDLGNEFIPYVKKNNIKIVVMSSFGDDTETQLNNLRKYVKFCQIVNFSGNYRDYNDANLITSKTDYYKIKLMNGNFIKNSYVLYHPVDTATWLSLQNENLKPIIEQDKRITIGRIGRAEPSKWNYLILATLNYFKKKKAFNKYRFVFAGMPKLYKWYIQLKFKKELKNGSIILLPLMKNDIDVSRFYQSIDIFFQTAWVGESFGFVIAEAFSHSVPVITDCNYSITKNKVVKPNLYDAQIELVDHKNNGLYANYPKTIYDSLNQVNKEQLKLWGENGLEKTIMNYESIVVTKVLENIIPIILKEKYNFDGIYPTRSEIYMYENEYHERSDLFKLEDHKVKIKDRKKYKINAKLFRYLEYVYLAFRKIYFKLFNKWLED